MENKKPINKLIIIFVTLLALCALILVIIFFLKNNNSNKKDTSPVSFIDETNQIVENTTNNNDGKSNIYQNGTSTGAVEGTGTSSGIDTTGTGVSDGTNGTGASETNGTGEGNGTFSGNGNASSGTLNVDENGNGTIGIGGNENSGDGTGFVQDENGAYSADVEMEENSQINELVAKNGGKYAPDYEDLEDEDPGKSNIKEYDDWNLTVKGNDYSILPIKLNLLNAPYHNDEYCEGMLTQNYFNIKLTSKPEGSSCTGYPEKVTINNDGKLNVDKHIYTKTGNIDLTNTKFSELGDYVFSIYPENSKEELYQIIVTLRGVTLEDGTALFRTYSLIQIKSLLKNGEKVNGININVLNPNTSITIDKAKNVNSFWEQVYVDVYIDSYENERYTVVNGNAEYASSSKIGDHYVVRTAKENIIPQTYKMANDGKIIIGRKSVGAVATMVKIASTNEVGNLNIASNTADNFEIPAGTKYKAEFSAEKRYREDYDMEGGGEFRVAKENAEENEVKISNLTNGNPKTGVFYSIIPFIIVAVLAIIGVIIIKRMHIKDDTDEKEE